MLKRFTLTTLQGQTLFEGYYKTIKDCIQGAADQNINLSHGNFKHLNLTAITLDGATLHHADFTGANLTGANLSEANLQHAILDKTTLYNTCFASSNLQNVSFAHASCGGTDITDAILNTCRFSGISCFDLNFITARSMQNCTYTGPNNTNQHFSTPPLVTRGITSEPSVNFHPETARTRNKC